MYYKSLTNHELIKKLKEAEDFDSVLALSAEVCERAGLLEEYAASDGESFESILDRAIEILKEGL